MDIPTTRDHNRASVIDVISKEAPITRERIIARTRLSKATVSRMVEELRVDGLLSDGPVAEGEGRGRRSTAVDLAPGTGFAVGVDLGQRLTRVLVADVRGRTLAEHSVETATGLGGAETAEWIHGQIQQAIEPLPGRLQALAVGVPGRVSKRSNISRAAASLRGIEGTELHDRLQSLYEIDVVLDSDANMALLGEISQGLVSGARDAVLLSASTAFGIAQSVNGKIVAGRSSAFGDFLALHAPGVDAPLGEVLSVNGLRRIGSGAREYLSAETVEALWQDPGDHTELIQLFENALVEAITIVAVTLDPATIILSGRLLPLIERVQPTVQSRLFERLGSAPPIRMTTQHGFAGARGALHAAVRGARSELRQRVLTLRTVS